MAVTGRRHAAHVLKNGQILDAGGEIQGGSGQGVVDTTQSVIDYGKVGKKD